MDKKMTKEKAVHILMHIDTYVEYDEDFGIMVKSPLMDASLMAIKALKANTTEPKCGWWLPFFEEVEIYNTGGFKEKRQTGWICSECGKGFTQFGHQKYCGNCGVKMNKGELI